MEKSHTRRIDTSLSELIAAASEVAFECSDNDKEAYRFARLALIEILRTASHPLDSNEHFDHPSTQKQYLH